MTTANRTRPTAITTSRRDRTGFLFLVIGGAAFFASGPLHPRGSDAGDKTEQLHSMLVGAASCNAQFAGPKMCTPQSPINPVPKS